MSIACPPGSGSDLLTRLREMIDQERLGAARPLLNAVLRLTPASEDAGDLQARVLLLEGNISRACAVLDEAITHAPGSIQLRLTRVAARERAGDVAGAARDAAEAVVLAPTLAQPKALLGALLNKLGRPEEARACLEEAVGMAPGDARYRVQLAGAQAACGGEQAAAETLEEGLAHAPRDIGLRTSTILSRMRRSDFAGAEALALAAARGGIADACIFGLLGHARSSLGHHAEAAEAYAEARKLAPEDPYVRHLAAAGGLAADSGRASADYVRVVFDGYASRFDTHLIALGYRIPGLMQAALARLRPAEGRLGPVLDLGCGTGLLAVVAGADHIGPWIGVDLSAGMLAQAEKHDLYAELHEAEITEFLATERRQFPLIVAGDVLPYLGDLLPLLALLAPRLLPGGKFLFSVEQLADDHPEGRPWRLGRLGRYAHSKAHVAEAAAAAGLVVASMRDEAVRLEIGEPVRGLFVMLECVAA